MSVPADRPRSSVRPSGLALMLAVLALALTGLTPAPAEPRFPALTGRVVDNANILSADDEAQLAAESEALEARTTDQLVVVTLPSLQGYDIADFGYRLGRHWGIGQKGKDNGVLLIVAPKERKVRIEVGRGLEATLPDAIAKIIIENAILPRFRAGDMPGGIRTGAGDIVKVLTGDAEAVKLRARKPRDEHGEIVAFLIVAIWLIIFFAVIWSVIQSVRQGAGPGGGRRSGGSGWGSGSSGSGWSSGGGGFSGGGGGFGGGGASGGW